MKFKKYECHMQGKDYTIYIPDIIPKDMWINPVALYGTWYWSDFLDSDRYGFECVKHISVILTKHPNAIVYFPIRKNMPIYEGVQDKDDCWSEEFFDILFYNKQIQFKRSKWKKIKKMIPFTKTLFENIKCDDKFMSDKAEYAQRRWDSIECYKHKRDRIVRYAENEVFFMECQHPLIHYLEWKDLNEFLKRDDLDEEATKCGHCIIDWAYGFELGYVSREIYKIWQERK